MHVARALASFAPGLPAILGSLALLVSACGPEASSPTPAEVEAFLELTTVERSTTPATASAAPTGGTSLSGLVGPAASRRAPAGSNAYARALVTRQADPPYGPERLPLLDAERIEDWERSYYQSRPDEYDRFVERFGDVHDLR